MISLPYVPVPLPDEILGSWLARVSLHNGDGAWRSLLEKTGYGRKLVKPLFDTVNYEARLATLLTVLGTSYEKVLWELTTLPYWLTFDAAPPEQGTLPGTTKIPKLMRHGNLEALSLTLKGRGHSSLRVYYCPKCLENDYATYGEPYWHRVHQLPNMFSCPHHYCDLRSACPNCNLAINCVGQKMLDVPSIYCSCGYDLRRVSQQQPMPLVFSRLAQISVLALKNGQPQWHRGTVRAYLRTILLDVDSSHGSYAAVLSKAFGLARGIDGDLTGEVLTQCNSHRTLRLKGYLSTSSAPECCALLSALNTDFETVVLGLEVERSGSRPAKRENKIALESLTVEQARREIVLRVSRHSNYPAAHKLLYWYLRIYDSEWLQRTFPGAATERMPSIADDRKTLLGASKGASLPWKKLRLKGCFNLAILRSKIRDQGWYCEQSARWREECKNRYRNRSRALYGARLALVEEALERILREEKRPEQIFASTLAHMAGISYAQMTRLRQAHPGLRMRIAKLNAELSRRRLVWAARDLRNEGCYLSATAISKRAQVRLTKSTQVLLEQYGLNPLPET